MGYGILFLLPVEEIIVATVEPASDRPVQPPPPASERRRRWAERIHRILERLGVSTVVPRAHWPPEWVAGREQEERAVLLRDEGEFCRLVMLQLMIRAGNTGVFLNRMLLEPSDQSLRDPLWIFQLGEMADTRHHFQGQAIGEGFRTHHIPGDLGNAAVHVAANAQGRHLDRSVKQAAEFE